MIPLSALTYVKDILLDPKVIMGIALVGAVAYHYFTVSGLEKDILTLENNYNKSKSALETSNNTILSMDNDIKQLKESRVVSEESYINEISQLKNLILTLEKKPKYTEVIKLVPVEGECSIKVKKSDNTDDNNSILKIISTIGKIGENL